MNEREIVNNMIAFVEEKERQLQLSKLTAEQAKSDIVKSILDELERVSAEELVTEKPHCISWFSGFSTGGFVLIKQQQIAFITSNTKMTALLVRRLT